MSINYLAVVVAAIASMVIGSIWYGPLFGKLFMQLNGMDKWSEQQRAEMKASMTRAYILQFIASFVMFLVLAWYIVTGPYYDLRSTFIDMRSGIFHALLVWIGFVVPLALGNAIWGGKTKLFWLQIGNMLITLLVAGAIIGAWR